MDSMLKGLFGGQDDDDSQRNKAQDFVSRYEQGSPHDNLDDDEVVNNYQAVAGRLSPQEYEDSAAEAYERLSPEERRQFAQHLQQQSGSRMDDMNTDDPRELARYTSRVQAEQPDGLAGLLGGGGGGLGGMLQNPMARGVMGGIAAMAMRKMMGGRR